MASILGNIIDKQGNSLPGLTIIARIASNPSGDTSSAVTNDLGNYDITVGNTGTKYNIYINSEDGGTDGPNWAGVLISSGDVVSSFSLYADSGWKVEHYGDDNALLAGQHKSIIADDILLRSAGNKYIKTGDDWFDFRFNTDTTRLRLERDTGNSIIWMNPYPVVGSDNYDLGLPDDYLGADNYFYLGSSKNYYIRSDGKGSFNALDVAGPSILTGNVLFSGVANIFSYLPFTGAYIEPTADVQFVQKKYVDDEIAASGGGGGAATASTKFVEMHKITAGESAAGFFDLTFVPIDESGVQVWKIGGVHQINKKFTGFSSSGLIADHDVLNDDELHFNDNGAATGLSGEIVPDDVLIISYDVSASS